MLGKFKESLKGIKSEGIIFLNMYLYFMIHLFIIILIHNFQNLFNFFLSHIAKCKERSKVVRKYQWFRNHILPMYKFSALKFICFHNVTGTYFWYLHFSSYCVARNEGKYVSKGHRGKGSKVRINIILFLVPK